MDHLQFNGQMNRLAAAYRIEIPAATRAAYWTIFGSGDDARFATACEQALRTERSFPTPAALSELINGSVEIRRRTGVAGGSGGPPRQWTAADFDVPFVAKPTPWRPGSRAHERWLHASARLMTLLERRLTERLAELDNRPDDPELQRRVLVLTRTLAERSTWHAHFEATGESLMPAGAP
jgi:hypothetical protein